MPLYGTFDTMQLADLLQWINTSRISGTLSVSIDTEETYMVFEKGDLIEIGSGDPLRLDLGQRLLHRGRIDDAQIDAATKLTAQGTALLDALLEQGSIDEETANDIQRENAFDTVLDLFFQEEGNFHFTAGEELYGIVNADDVRHTSKLRKPISTQALLMEEMRRLDEWTRIREIFPNNYVIISAGPGPSDNPIFKELQKLGEPISTGALFQHLGGSRFDLYRNLYELQKAGHVELDHMQAGTPDNSGLGPVDVLIDNAKLLMAEQQFDEAREVLFTAASLSPDNAGARSMLAEIRKEQLAYLYQQIQPHRVVSLAVPKDLLAEHQLTPREAYLAQRLNGRWDVATLVIATPLGELETLRILRKFLHAGIASIEESN